MFKPPRHILNPPFTVNILESEGKDAAKCSGTFHGRADDFAHLLPATYRSQEHHLLIPRKDIYGFLEAELLITKLNDIHNWMLIVGRPTPPRALHHQILINRSILVTEQAELHLVWTKHRIFIKPLPKFLLDPAFWTKYLVCPPASNCANNNNNDPKCAQRANLASLAHGFLLSYAALIAHESDFKVATDHALLPAAVTWAAWKRLTEQLLDHDDAYASINPRYWYGELRLARLNTVYRFRHARIFRAYSSVTFYSCAADFFADNLGKLAAFLGYAVIVLTAMQVGLATDRLRPDGVFQRASYGFAVFAIVAPLLAVALLLAVFLCLAVSNWTVTRRFQRERFGVMGVLAGGGEGDVEGGGKEGPEVQRGSKEFVGV